MLKKSNKFWVFKNVCRLNWSYFLLYNAKIVWLKPSKLSWFHSKNQNCCIKFHQLKAASKTLLSNFKILSFFFSFLFNFFAIILHHILIYDYFITRCVYCEFEFVGFYILKFDECWNFKIFHFKITKKKEHFWILKFISFITE